MGRQHALAGSAAFLALSPALETIAPMSTGETILGAVLAAGGAMVPDLDQPGSTIARTYGPLTNVVARLVGFVSGGHRQGTHSLVGVAAATAIAAAAAASGGLLLAVTTWVLLGVAARAYDLGLEAHPALTAALHAVVMGAVTAAVLAAGADLTGPLVGGVAIGAASHLATDCLTPQGCPLLWPFLRHRSGVGLVTTGSRWSGPVVTAALTIALVVAAAATTPLGPWFAETALA